mmetsp:Transcript_39615/g.104575  ORF Transcript_39615/g.104575 Transcript_39615/m.104575 type:complete len:288 (-) Transcript_39615:183-1046(-)
MCIFALAIESHEDFPFILIHNRDEDWNRATDPLAEHEDGQLYCKDLKAGGTFLGFSMQSSAFGAITNVRSQAPRPTSSQSRGDLVLLALNIHASSMALGAYTAFNLWHGNVHPPAATHSRSLPDISSTSGWTYSESRVPIGEVIAQSNEPRHGLQSEWPKTRLVRERTSTLIRDLPPGASSEALRDGLANIFTTQLCFGDDVLPDFSFSPLPPWRERELQNGPLISRDRLAQAARAHEVPDVPYGTLCQTVIISCAPTKSIHYYCRSLKSDDQMPLPWQEWKKPWDT